MTSDVNDGALHFSVLTKSGLCLSTESKDEQDGTVIVVAAMVAELLGMQCDI